MHKRLKVRFFIFPSSRSPHLVLLTFLSEGFGGLVITFTSLFGGILIRPSAIPNFWIFMYWLFPGHYVYESIIMSQYNDDNTPIVASLGSPFYDALNCAATTPVGEACIGPASLWVASNFTDWDVDSIPFNFLYMLAIIVATRVVTYYALTNFDYRSN
jgi:ABC-2 type transporter